MLKCKVIRRILWKTDYNPYTFKCRSDKDFKITTHVWIVRFNLNHTLAHTHAHGDCNQMWIDIQHFRCWICYASPVLGGITFSGFFFLNMFHKFRRTSSSLVITRLNFALISTFIKFRRRIIKLKLSKIESTSSSCTVCSLYCIRILWGIHN